MLQNLSSAAVVIGALRVKLPTLKITLFHIVSVQNDPWSSKPKFDIATLPKHDP